MSGRFAVDRQPKAKGNAHSKHRGRPGSWHNPLPLAIPSVMDAAERIPSTDTALRADDLHLLVNDRPRSPVNGELLPAGGSHARAVRTQVIRSLSNDSQLELNILLQMEIGAMVANDSLASPNQSPRRRSVVHSAGKDVQRHVISESVPGSYIPMRQVADANQATYETVEVDSLSDMSMVEGFDVSMRPMVTVDGYRETLLTDDGMATVRHGRALTLSDLRLELGITVRGDSGRSTFTRQLEAALHCLEMVKAIEAAIESGKLVI